MKIGIVGWENVPGSLKDLLVKEEGFTLAGVYNLNEDNTSEAAKSFTSMDALVSSSDAIILGKRDILTFEWVKLLAKQSKPVFCLFPFDFNHQQVVEIHNLINEGNSYFQFLMPYPIHSLLTAGNHWDNTQQRHLYLTPSLNSDSIWSQVKGCLCAGLSIINSGTRKTRTHILKQDGNSPHLVDISVEFENFSLLNILIRNNNTDQIIVADELSSNSVSIQWDRENSNREAPGNYMELQLLEFIQSKKEGTVPQFGIDLLHDSMKAFEFIRQNRNSFLGNRA